MKLSVIFVSYNTADLTVAALQSVTDQILASATIKRSSEIIVVDNASQDESLKKIRQFALQHPSKIQVLSNRKNVGFSAANNQGLNRAKGEYALLLNTDTLLKQGALESLIEVFESHPISELTANLKRTRGEVDRLGIVAAQLLNPNLTDQPQGGSFPTLLALANHWLMIDDLPLIGKWLPSTQHTGGRADPSGFGPSTELILKDWVGGTAMMIRREVWEEIGLLDENIFMYGEDVEYCLRAQAHHWDIAIAPQAQVIHYGSASSSSVNAIRGEMLGYLYIWAKHKPLWQLPLVRLILAGGALLRWIVFGTMKPNSQLRRVYGQLVREVWKQ